MVRRYFVFNGCLRHLRAIFYRFLSEYDVFFITNTSTDMVDALVTIMWMRDEWRLQ